MTTLNGLPVPWCKLSNLPELFLCNVTLGDGVVSEEAVDADVDVDDDITESMFFCKFVISFRNFG